MAAGVSVYPAAKRVVVKVGSMTLSDDNGQVDVDFIAELVHDIADLRAQGVDVVLVTSGAIMAGVNELKLDVRPKDIPSLQACASVGQATLINLYDLAFNEFDISIGQVLLTRNDTADRTAYLHAQNTFEKLLEFGCVPIVNENDALAVDEIKFGDNDSLAALVSALIGADQLILMSDIDGLYTADPRTNPNAKLIPFVGELTDEIVGGAKESSTGFGTGGMATKVSAARSMMLAGIPMTICLGRKPGVLVEAARGIDVGTRFSSDHSGRHENAKKLWLGLAGTNKGRLYVDHGAVNALRKKGSSLLACGIDRVEGRFTAGELVNVLDESGQLIGRGLAGYSADDIELTRGMTSEMVMRVLSASKGAPVIHRDDLLVF